jgi:hypothetical protein
VFAFFLLPPLIMALLTLSLSPSVPLQPRPSAVQVANVRAILTRMRSKAEHRQPQSVAFSWADVSDLVQLGNQVSHRHRFAFSHEPQNATGQASLLLGHGVWVNASVNALPTPKGFPALTMRIGRLSLSPALSRAAIRLGHWFLIKRGIGAPPLDVLVNGLTLSATGIASNITLPRDGKLLAVLATTPSAGVDTALVIDHYCRITKLQRDQPNPDFSVQVNRAFAGVETAAQSRAALTALAMLTVSPDAGAISGDIKARIKPCILPPQSLTLLGRQDLPKHWALSAALTANFGSSLSQAMGTWKEVSDSAPGGSGFSFIDLAADRSGTGIGRLSSADDSAAATALKMRTASQDQLLPIRALALAEGMSEDQFTRRFTSIDSARYDAMIKRIDAVLDGRDR